MYELGKFCSLVGGFLKKEILEARGTAFDAVVVFKSVPIFYSNVYGHTVYCIVYLSTWSFKLGKIRSRDPLSTYPRFQDSKVSDSISPPANYLPV